MEKTIREKVCSALEHKLTEYNHGDENCICPTETTSFNERKDIKEARGGGVSIGIFGDNSCKYRIQI
jgi:hypothetical protein